MTKKFLSLALIIIILSGSFIFYDLTILASDNNYLIEATDGEYIYCVEDNGNTVFYTDMNMNNKKIILQGNEDYFDLVLAKDGYLYFNVNNESFSVINIRNGEITKIWDTTARILGAYDDCIYYTYEILGEGGPVDFYYCKLDGSDNRLVADNTSARAFGDVIVENNKLYYFQCKFINYDMMLIEERLIKSDLNGDNSEVIADWAKYGDIDIYDYLGLNNYNYHDFCKDDKYSDCSFLNIVDNKLYYTDKEYKRLYYLDIKNNCLAYPISANLIVNGEQINFSMYNINGSNYFKLRDIAYILNGTNSRFDVSWDSAQNLITIKKGINYNVVGGEMSPAEDLQNVSASNAEISIDGQNINFITYNIGGNNYFKLRDIAAQLGFYVDWDSISSSIIINT